MKAIEPSAGPGQSEGQGQSEGLGPCPAVRRRRRTAALALAGILAGAGLAAAAVDAAAQREIARVTAGHLFRSVAEVPAHPVALVFGAGIRGGRPSPILLDRIRMAVALYKARKVRKLLMTGDNGSPYYNEVAVMRRTAMRLGVPGRDVVKDHAGFRTYDSCYRAREVFGVRSAILVTQAFHLPRAVYLARRMGIDADGVSADAMRGGRGTYGGYYRWREQLAACGYAWLQVNFTHPRPRYLGPRISLFDTAASPLPGAVLRPHWGTE